MNFFKGFLGAIAIINLCVPLWGLDPQKAVTQYAQSNWRTERGLPNNSLLAIAQDRSGYLWLGTTEGLVRFDGVLFTVFNSGNTVQFQDNYVNNLFVDNKGTLWIGTLRGTLLSLEEGKFKSHLFAGGISGMSNYCIAEDDRGTLWLGTFEGLFFREPASQGPMQRDGSFPAVRIFCLARDPAGRLLASASGHGLLVLDGKRWRPLAAGPGRLSSDVYVIKTDRAGRLWLGADAGLFNFWDGKVSDFSSLAGLHTPVTSMIEDRDGHLWVGCEAGLYRWRRGEFQSLTTRQALASNQVQALVEDQEGSLWVGAIDGGLTQIRDETITSFSASEGLAGVKFRSMHGDESGALWIGGDGGVLQRLYRGRIEKFALPVRFRGASLFSLEKEADGSLWLGTELGLLHFKDGRFRELPLPGRASGMETRCVLKDRSGRLWIGTWGGGLLCRKGEAFISYSAGAGLPDDRISSLFEDRDGNLWVGCERGLALMAPTRTGAFSAVPYAHDSHVFSFHEDARGGIWIGTHQGLKVLKNGRWGSLNTDRGLFDRRAYVIHEDDLGYLWLSSERGIFRAEKQEMERAAFDPSLKVHGRLFDETDGLKSRICDYGNPAGWKDERGRLWFANLAGVVSVDPAHIRQNDRVPPVLVEQVVVDNRRLPTAKTPLATPLPLAAGSKRFEFKYTALSFIRSDKIAFKYKLEGYDKDWTEAGGRREAFYNDLRPGPYRFRVIAANADGVWNTAGASFAFYLRPFVYQTGWFMALAVLAFMAVSVLLWQLLKKYLRAVTFWKKKTYIGHFKILETIGTGGMATVYRAQDTLDKKRIVALKVLKEENFLDENQRKRFKHESLITEQLDHPHIVHIIERGEMEDCWYIAMELLHGRSLGRLIRDEGRLEIGAALDIMLQVVDALRAIHGQNIVHRDLKPENIMVSERRGRQHFVKLLDFGLAITPAQSRLTVSGVVMGTIRYLPPERISDGTSSPAGDIYAAGIILYEMLTGSKPFWSEATGEVIHRILETYPIAAGEINPLVPPDLEALIKAMIDKDPARRPTLAAVEGELRRLAAKIPGPAKGAKS